MFRSRELQSCCYQFGDDDDKDDKDGENCVMSIIIRVRRQTIRKKKSS
jgi:hypothetical protein